MPEGEVVEQTRTVKSVSGGREYQIGIEPIHTNATGGSKTFKGESKFPVFLKQYDSDASKRRFPVLLKWYDSRFRPDKAVKEASALVKLEHPNIVRVIDVASDGKSTYLVTKAIPGAHDLYDTPELAPDDQIKVVSQIAGALDFANGQHIYHKDVKPGNILVTDDGHEVNAYLADFGVANIVHQPKEGNVVGTAMYMTPEQAQGVPVETEVKSLALVAFYLVTEGIPYNEVLASQVTDKDDRELSTREVMVAVAKNPKFCTNAQTILADAGFAKLIPVFEAAMDNKYTNSAEFAADFAKNYH